MSHRRRRAPGFRTRCPLATAQPLAERLRALVQAGLARWNGHKLARIAPAACVAEGRSVADLLVSDRETDAPAKTGVEDLSC